MHHHLSALIYAVVLISLLLTADQHARIMAAEGLSSAAAFRATRALQSSLNAERLVESDALSRAREHAALVMIPLAPETNSVSSGSTTLDRAITSAAATGDLDLPPLRAALNQTSIEAWQGQAGNWSPISPGAQLPQGALLKVQVTFQHTLRADPSALLFADEGLTRTITATATAPLGAP